MNMFLLRLGLFPFVAVLAFSACPAWVPASSELSFACSESSDCADGEICVEGRCDLATELSTDAGVIIGEAGSSDSAPFDSAVTDAVLPDSFVDVDAGPCQGALALCDGDQLLLCNGDGSLSAENDCSTFGCNSERNACNECVPNQIVCSDDAQFLQTCAASGVVAHVEACTYGCDSLISTPSCFACEVDSQWCDGDIINTCTDGHYPTNQLCPLGCSDAGGVHCKLPQISNLGDVFADSTKFADIIELDATEHSIDTEYYRIDGVDWHDHEEIGQGAGKPKIAVFKCSRFHLAEGGTLTVTGNRALAIVVWEDMQIDGVIDVSAQKILLGDNNYKDWHTPGPGGFAGGNKNHEGHGDCKGKVGSGDGTGGSGSGGGGFADSGGEGGVYKSNDDYVPGNGGQGSCGNMELVPLLGGSGGAGGYKMKSSSGDYAHASCAGGGGGGAVLLAAQTSVFISGTGGIVSAGGGGAQCGNASGAGGGAGGAILIEAVQVQIAGFIAANGGGGAEGDCT